MNKKGINRFLQIKVLKHMEYMYEESRLNYRDNKFFTDSLSNTLKEQVFIEIYGKILKENDFFSKNFSEIFLNKLSSYFKEITFSPDDLISAVIKL